VKDPPERRDPNKREFPRKENQDNPEKTLERPLLNLDRKTLEEEEEERLLKPVRKDPMKNQWEETEKTPEEEAEEEEEPDPKEKDPKDLKGRELKRENPEFLEKKNQFKDSPMIPHSTVV